MEQTVRPPAARPDAPWRIGDVFVLRHAGMPFEWIESLGLSGAVLAAMDAVLECAARLEAAVEAAAGAKAARRVRAALESGSEALPLPAGLPDVKTACAAWRDARRHAVALYEEELDLLRGRLHELSARPRVQEAVFLSNPAMYESVWRRYVDRGGQAPNAKQRRVERQAYAYLQRFCAKNETTSFFGPMGYGEVDDGEGLRVERLPETRRKTSIAHWAVEELKRAIVRDPGIAAHVPLRRNPSFRVRGATAANSALGAEIALSPDAVRLLALIDGDGSATLKQAAEALGLTVRGCVALVKPLLAAGLLQRTLWTDAETPDGLDTLIQATERLADTPARTLWLTRLAAVERLRSEFERAGLERRRVLLTELEDQFTQLTQVPARRGEGAVYADRLVISEEASSPFRLRMGRRFAEALARSIGPALELSAAYGERVHRGWRAEMAGTIPGDSGSMEFLAYVSGARPEQLAGSSFSPLPIVELDVPDGSAVPLPADHLGTATDGPRFALPDICLALAEPAGAEAPPGTVVVSRVHHQLLVWGWLAAFHPDRDRFDAVASRWLEGSPEGRATVALGVGRRNKAFYSFPGPRLTFGAGNGGSPGSPGSHEGNLPAAECTVALDGDGPRLVDPEGRRRYLYLPLVDLTAYPPLAALGHPPVVHVPLRTTEPHLGRVTVGEGIYQRERWQTDLGPLLAHRGFDLMLAVRALARRLGFPRFVFARFAAERKPYLFDTHSPFGAELVCHAARSGSSAVLEEMCPGPRELWLRDEDGSYTCELRMQAERAGHEDGPAAL